MTQQTLITTANPNTKSAFMKDMSGFCASALHDFADIPLDSAEQIAHHVANHMVEYWGGSMLYIPKTNPAQIHKRDLAIWHDFAGNNHNALARKYHLSVVTIYQIIAKVRKSLPKKQADLFD